MKREEQIREAARRDDYDDVVFGEIFAEGARWADAHPKVDINDVCRSYEEWHKSRMQELLTKVAAPPLWISVEDELPIMYDSYITCTNGNIIEITHYNIEGWHTESGGKVTHWMPLPAPPKSSCSEIPTNCQSVTQRNQSKE